MIKGVLFDVIGTTVVETDPATITGAFDQAFGDHGLTVDEEAVRANRGRDKKEMIDLLLAQQKQDANLAPKIYQSFVENVEARLQNLEAREGAEALFDHLLQRGIKIGLGTGLSRDLFEKIMNHLGWPLNRFDYIGIPENGIRPRPHPDMIHDMLKKLNFTPAELIKVGDTVADIQEGKNAGVITAAILAGTQSKEALESAKPDFLITTLSDLKGILL